MGKALTSDTKEIVIKAIMSKGTSKDAVYGPIL